MQVVGVGCLIFPRDLQLDLVIRPGVRDHEITVCSVGGINCNGIVPICYRPVGRAGQHNRGTAPDPGSFHLRIG